METVPQDDPKIVYEDDPVPARSDAGPDQASWMSWAEYLKYGNPRVASFTFAPWRAWQTLAAVTVT